ncbi:hypothetical protein Tco_1473998 [Tanacetum coccineum]
MEADEELEIDKLNDDNVEIRGNVRVCESESKSYNDNNDRLLKDDCETSLGMNQLNQSMNKQTQDAESQNTQANNVSLVPLQVNVQSPFKACLDNCDSHSYADKVIYDEELVTERSKKWELSACGYFVGYRMSIQELRYHLYRMWGKFGLKHILNNGNGVFVFNVDPNPRSIP